MPISNNSTRDAADALYHRARLVILGAQAPISRLQFDVVGIDRFAVPGPLTPNIAMVTASPELTPPARDIVMLTVRLFGERLFRRPTSELLKAYAYAGPIATAETMLLIDHPVRTLDLYDELLDGFESIFAMHPQVYLARARRTLSSFNAPRERG